MRTSSSSSPTARTRSSRPNKAADMFKRYPYTIGLLLVVSIICCLAWLLTHDACMHPLGNGLAAWWAFVNAPLFLVGLVEEAGGEE